MAASKCLWQMQRPVTLCESLCKGREYIFVCFCFFSGNLVCTTCYFDILNFNQVHNILRLFDVLPNFSIITSETMCVRLLLINNGVCELPHELPNDLRLRILGNKEISGNCLNVIEWQPSAQFPRQNESFVNTRRKLLKIRK